MLILRETLDYYPMMDELSFLRGDKTSENSNVDVKS